METVVSSDLTSFAPRPVKSSVLETTEVTYNPLASVDHSDLEFLIPSDNDTYLDPNIKLYVRGKLTKANGADLDDSDFTAVTKNLLHSLFSQCKIVLKGATVKQAADLYNYRSFFGTIMTYGSD